MYEIDINWIKEQLTRNKTKKYVGDAVLSLLEVWGTLKSPPKVDMSVEVLDIFSKLAKGYSIVQDDKEEIWVQALAGDIKIADIVRVKYNAFDENSGKNTLNGRRGVIVGLRYGDIVIKTNDGVLPVLDGVHIKAVDLEKLI